MLPKSAQRDYLLRIQRALKETSGIAKQFLPGSYQVRDNGGRDVVTEVDRRISDALRSSLLESGEGWLSEEDADDKSRLAQEVVWIVDPLDGTREFVDGIPEWSISIGLVVKGAAVAGGICNPATGEVFLGATGCGVSYNGKSARVTTRTELRGAEVLASRQECKRGEWNHFANGLFTVRPVGSVAYKLALVAAGLADATWTLAPKHEWDVAAGVALVEAAGGRAGTIDDSPLQFNRTSPLLPGLIASGRGLWNQIQEQVATASRKDEKHESI